MNDADSHAVVDKHLPTLKFIEHAVYCLAQKMDCYYGAEEISSSRSHSAYTNEDFTDKTNRFGLPIALKFVTISCNSSCPADSFIVNTWFKFQINVSDSKNKTV